MHWPRLRRHLELLGVAGALFLALLGTGAVLAPDFTLATAEAAGFLRDEQRREREHARRLGAELEAWRRERLERVAHIREALTRTRGAFSGGIHALAVDPEGRLLIGGQEDPELWLGVLRFEPDGTIDEGFARNVSLAFERDLAVGGVAQILPLPDGRILLRGSFRRPKTFLGRRPEEALSIGFVLLDEAGRVDEAWFQALRTQWSSVRFAGSAILGAAGTVWFTTTDGLASLRVDEGPMLVEAVPSRGPWMRAALCRAGPDRWATLLAERLQLLRGDGSPAGPLAPQLDPDTRIGTDPQPTLHCGEGDASLALFPLLRVVLDGPGASGVGGPDSSFWDDRIGSSSWTRAGTLAVSLRAETIAAVLPHPLKVEAMAFSKRLDRWVGIGGLDGSELARQLFTIQLDPISLTPGRALALGRPSAMRELPDGRWVIAAHTRDDDTRTGRERSQRLYLLDRAADQIAPY